MVTRVITNTHTHTHNKNSKCLMRTYSVPSTVLNALHALSHLISVTILGSKYLHFILQMRQLRQSDQLKLHSQWWQMWNSDVKSDFRCKIQCRLQSLCLQGEAGRMNEGSTAAVPQGAVGPQPNQSPCPVATALPPPWCSAEMQAIALIFFACFFMS